MKSLVELQTEIETLQQQASELRNREFDRTVADIVAQMAAFGITLAQLKSVIKKAPAARPGRPKGRRAAAKSVGRPKKKAGSKGAKKTKAAKQAAKQAGTRGPAKIKFRGPAGETWSGRGKTPTWLKGLLAAGRQADDFRV